MSKNIKIVFLIIGALFLGFIIWDLFFNPNGILQTAYNGLISPINNVWQTVTGDSSSRILPQWGTTGANSDGYLDTDGTR